MHAPLSDPGGVPHTRQNASGTVAFRCLQTVGFPLRTALRDILLSTTRHISGLKHAACLLAPSSFVRPLLGWHVEFAPDRLARRSSGVYRSTVFWTPSDLKLSCSRQGTLLLVSHLGGCFVSMPPNQPGLIVLTLKLVQRQAEFFHRIKGLEP
jgi:hypothetical protein